MNKLLLGIFFVYLGILLVSATPLLPNLPQESIVTASDGPPNVRLGNSLTGGNIGFLEDFNGDGYSEFFGGATAPGQGGFVLIFDGKTGNTIRSLQGTVPAGTFGAELANLGDVNGNGFSDLAVLEENYLATARIVYIFDTFTGFLLYQISVPGGFSIDNAGDVNNDGLSDLVISSAVFSGGGTTNILSSLNYYNGANGVLIRQNSLPLNTYIFQLLLRVILIMMGLGIL